MVVISARSNIFTSGKRRCVLNTTHITVGMSSISFFYQKLGKRMASILLQFFSNNRVTGPLITSNKLKTKTAATLKSHKL